MTIQVCVDIETLSKRANAVVLSMGVCFFDDERLQPFDELVAHGMELFFCRDAQSSRHIDPGTIDWWAQQGDAARRVLEAQEVIEPRDFHRHLEAHCEKVGVNYNWVRKYGRWFSRGNAFDIAILDDMFADHNVASPWKYYKVRCVRTWLECHGLEDNAKLVKPAAMIAHNALHDAAFDAAMIQTVLHVPEDQWEIDKR
jgi:hypothetical protein